MLFGREYYESIWGTVHRHDYCDYWASELIRRFGRCSVLDIGTGCGFLVKTLRERGCDAWGLEISDYAIANSCALGYVLKASVTDIPFKDERFDVVFSNGLWEYIEENDVAKGRDEIWRIGRSQLHEIDHSGVDYPPSCVTWKSLGWWNEQLAAPKILVSCPTHQSKEYAHSAWLEMARSINYPNYEIFVVDNSPTPDCSRRWGFEWLGDYNPAPLDGDQCQRMASSMEIAREKFLREDLAWWFNIEIDVIPHSGMLRELLRLGKGADWIAHCFPARGSTDELCSGIGCSLWSRRLIEDFEFTGSGDRLNHCVDSFMWQWVRPQKKYRTREFWSHLPIKHLKGPDE